MYTLRQHLQTHDLQLIREIGEIRIKWRAKISKWVWEHKIAWWSQNFSRSTICPRERPHKSTRSTPLPAIAILYLLFKTSVWAPHIDLVILPIPRVFEITRCYDYDYHSGLVRGIVPAIFAVNLESRHKAHKIYMWYNSYIRIESQE